MSVQTARKHCEGVSLGGGWPDFLFQAHFQEMRTRLAYRLLLLGRAEAINTFAAQINR